MHVTLEASCSSLCDTHIGDFAKKLALALKAPDTANVKRCEVVHGDDRLTPVLTGGKRKCRGIVAVEVWMRASDLDALVLQCFA